MFNEIEWMRVFCNTRCRHIFLLTYLPGKKTWLHRNAAVTLQAFTATPSQMAGRFSARSPYFFQTLAPITVKTGKEIVK